MDGVLQSLTMHLDSHPLEFHCHYITSAIQSWKEYLDYMSSELLALDQAASVPKAFIEFDVDFSVAQQLQSIRRKLIHAEAILGGMQALMAAIMDHARKLWELGGVSRPAHHTFLCEVEGIGGEIRSHSTTARELVAQSGDIQSMINNILNFQNQELLANNGLHLSRITEINRKDSGILVNMATQSSHDSRTTRIATLIAIIYLPASLVLSFFSTVFVHYEEGDGASMLIHREVWVAIVSMVALGVGTLCVFGAWHRLGK